MERGEEAAAEEGVAAALLLPHCAGVMYSRGMLARADSASSSSPASMKGRFVSLDAASCCCCCE